LPEFRGTLRVRIVSVDAIMLLIDGAYEPPGGLLGRAFDAIAGQRIARATARDFVTRIARDLERREAAWQQGFEPAASERGTT
jgi:hypothetical protein